MPEQLHHIAIELTGPITCAKLYINDEPVPVRRESARWTCTLQQHPVAGALKVFVQVAGAASQDWEMKVQLDKKSLIRFRRNLGEGAAALEKEIPFAD